MNLCFFSSSDFIIPILENIQKNSNLSLWQVFESQYLNLVDQQSKTGLSIEPRWWLNENLLQLTQDQIKLIKLETLFDEPVKLSLILTQPDRLNRTKLIQNPVATWAKQNNIQLFQPDKINKQQDEFQGLINSFKIDLAILASFGQLLSENVLGTPKYRFINWHPSLLPKYRGATPMQTAIANGDTQTGLSWLNMTKAMDAGNIWLQIPTNLNLDDTSQILSQKMGLLGSNTWALAVVAKLVESHYIKVAGLNS